MPTDRKNRIIDGEPGTSWENNTGKVQFQMRVSFINSCGRCIEDANKIGPFWPVPYHRGCNCSSVPIPPGQHAAPFLDYQEEVRKLDPTQQRRVMGKGNWALVEAGVIQWEDVVTRTRIRPLNEVVKRNRLTLGGMKKAGVNPRQAAMAWAKANSPDALAIQAKRSEIIAKLRDGGLTDAEIKEFLAKSLASKAGIGPGPPSGGGKAGPPPIPPRKPPLLPPRPPPKPPKPKRVPKPPKPIEPPPKPVTPPPPKPVEPPPKPTEPSELDKLKAEVERLKAEYDRIRKRDGNTFTEERFKARDAYLAALNRASALASGKGMAEPPEPIPGRIAPGPIADRIKAYEEGDRKVKAIVEGAKHLIDRSGEIDRILASNYAERTQLKQEDDTIVRQLKYSDRLTKKQKEEMVARRTEIKAQFDALAERRDTLRAERDGIGPKIHDHLVKAIAIDGKIQRIDVRPGVVTDYKGNPMEPLQGDSKTKLKDALEFLGKVVRGGDASVIDLHFGQRTDQRAHYWDHGGGNSNYVIVGQDTATKVYVHEIGHLIEYRVRTAGQAIAQRAQEFLKHRVGSEQPRKLNDVYGTNKYKDDEFGRKDKFDDAFGEDAWYVGKDYGPDASEVVSMGLEKLYDDPVGFATKDPEYCKFILGILDGQLR